ncbi:putative cysteine desulfurase [Cinnamomum micranthum f. kanehirae]|uniref:Putative cysteine desulfurase n=1 Tax=Cinnamomum micranthum f. kanehirae TaxID=337451 RepID=A0A3S3N958_9MAGN|nr:putative cysteine desulfurase [Cinnamomum micranthum f. kanehirae]
MHLAGAKEDGEMIVDDQRDVDDDIDLRAISFKLPQDGIINETKSDEEKCAWLRSQLVGNDVEFDTPFGKRHLTYADHTASGRCLHHIENYIVENVLPFYGNTHTHDSFVGHRTTNMVHEAAKYIKSSMGGGPEDAILFCGSGSTAAIKRLQEVMGIAIPSTMKSRVVDSLKPKERWVVFVGPYEHHSNLLSWRQSLAEVVEICVDKDGLVDMDMLRQELGSPKYSGRPMLGSFSACSNVTGIYTDTRALARLLHEHGAFACFDFATSGPYVRIDLRSGELEGYDAVFLSPHKLVGGPGTPGILLMSNALYYLGSNAPSTSAGGTVAFVNGFNEKDTLYYEDIEEREDAGTPAIVQKIRAALAFWVKEYMGYDLIDTQETLWIDRAFHRLLPNPNVHILGNTSVRRRPILSFLIQTTSLDPTAEASEKGAFVWNERATTKDKPLHGRFVTKLLNDLFGIQARGGCACAGPYGHVLLGVNVQQSLAFRSAVQKGYSGLKPGWTRVSFSYYLSVTEFEFLLAAIEFVAVYGQRFLPLYHFNWKAGDWTFRKTALQKLVGEDRALALKSLKLGGRMLSDSPSATLSQTHGSGIGGGSGPSMKHKYDMYLETARYVAMSLPKFPPQRRVPEGVDLDLILFRI